MTLKEKAKTYNFWISLASAIVLIVRIIGDKFDIFIDTSLIMDVTTGLCSIFVILGILSAPKIKSTEIKNEDANNQEITTTTHQKEENETLIAKNEIIENDKQNTPNSSEDNYNETNTEAEINTEIKNETEQPHNQKINSTATINLKVIIDSLKTNIEKANSMVNELTKNI